jgi:hypothetical protein
MSQVRSRRAVDRAGTGRRVRRARIDGFFFKTVPYLFHTRARLRVYGYHEHGYAGIFSCFCFLFLFIFGGYGYGYRFDVNRGQIFEISISRVGEYGYVGTGYAGGGYGYNGFFLKKGDRPFSNPYPFTRLYPGTDTGTGHGYGLYPAGFIKTLVQPNLIFKK